MSSQRWTIDPTLSTITFRIGRLAAEGVRGSFLRWGGHIDMDDRGLSESSVHIWVEASSLKSRESERDEEARSERFLETGRFPRIEFASTCVEVLDPGTLIVTGDLLLHGVTRPVRVEARYNGLARDGSGSPRVSWTAEATIDRAEFGLLWHPALEQVSGFLLGDEIDVTIDLEAGLDAAG